MIDQLQKKALDSMEDRQSRDETVRRDWSELGKKAEVQGRKIVNKSDDENLNFGLYIL